MENYRAIFDETCAVIAEAAQNIMLKDMFARDFCVRYSKSKGAYLSTEDYCDNIIIMRNNEFRRDFDYAGQVKNVKDCLSNKPVFPE